MIDVAAVERYYESTELLHRAFSQDGDPLSPIERRLAAWKLGILPREVRGPVKAIVLGETPSSKSSPWMPLFPHPRNGSGARLAKLAGQLPRDYLATWLRVDLVPTHRPACATMMVWSEVAGAKALAFVARLHALCRALGERGLERPRVVCLGRRVAELFGSSTAFERWTVDLGEPAGVAEFCSIPHPSGRNRAYLDPFARGHARDNLRWAARL